MGNIEPIRESGGVDVMDPAIFRTEKPEQKNQRPSFYLIVVHNDPITPRTFVTEMLKRYFNKTEPEAHRIMLIAHNYGVGVVAKYAHDIAESKAKRVNEVARAAGYPLSFSVEKED